MVSRLTNEPVKTMNTKLKSIIAFRSFAALLAALALAATPAGQAQITVGNVRAAQRSGTKLVDIVYDVTGVTTPVSVSLQISADGGTTWNVPVASASGAVGSNVTPGANLRITWNAGADWNNLTTTQMCFRIQVGNAPTDFALIPDGDFTMGDTLTLDAAADAPPDAPVHTVAVSAFSMQKKLVTKADWDAVRSGASPVYSDIAVGTGKAANHGGVGFLV